MARIKRTDPQAFFQDLVNAIEGLLLQIERGKRALYVLSPFLVERYVHGFIRFVQRLRRKGLLDDVTVITRHPKYFASTKRDYITRLIEDMRRAGIRVCFGHDKFHAKVVVIDDSYVIAGSINPLAPSHSEVLYKMPLRKYWKLLIQNPRSAKAIIRNLVHPLCPQNERLQATWPR